MSTESPLFRKFNAAELARATGITPRRVRYYVREKLIEAPLGRGRGRHYDYRHLYQIRRVLRLSEAGLSHAAIRADAEKLRRVLAEGGGDSGAVEFDRSRFSSRDTQSLDRDAPYLAGNVLPEPVQATRLRLAPGIELLIDDTHDLPEPERLAALIQMIGSAFGWPEAEPQTPGREHGERR